MTRLGKVPFGNDENFFYDALFSLIDVSWRKLAATYPDETQDDHIDSTSGFVRSTVLERAAGENLPVMNPFGFHSYYTEDDYDTTCEKLDHRSFLNAPRTMSYEVSFGTIISQARKAAKSSPPDRSKNFILNNSKRLSKFITNEQRRNRTIGYQDNAEDVKLALRIMEGMCSPPELTTASMDVVYIIVEILLDRCPTPRKRELPSRQDQTSKIRRTLKMLPGKQADNSHGPQQHLSQWPNGIVQNETESNLQAQPYNPYFNFDTTTSTNPGEFTPAFGGPDLAMLTNSLFRPGFDSNSTNSWGQDNFGDGVDIDALLSQVCAPFVPNDNEVQALGANTNTLLPTPVSQDDPDDLP